MIYDELKTRPAGRPKVSIGLFVYNGEKFIRKRLDSLLEQTFTDFELIISDNASTDSTSAICEEYAKKDKRIRYIRQEKNKGAIWNFIFVLEEAKSDYFVWAAVDDLLSPDFLEKNVKVLESNKNVVGSIGKVKPFDTNDNDSEHDEIDSAFRNFKKKLRTTFKSKSFGTWSISGAYEKKVRFYLKKSTCAIIYGVFRTDKLRESIVIESFIADDWAIMLNILKHGDFHVVDDVFLYRFERGRESKGIINLARSFNQGFHGIVFPWYPITAWCIKNLGIKIFLKNLDFFIQLNFEGMISFLIDLTRLFIHKISKKIEI